MRRLVSSAAMLLLFVAPFLSFSPASAQGLDSCASYDAWEWAQTVYESHKTRWAALDPDGDGTACPELPKGGFANAWWTETIPAETQEAELIRIIDGDTFEVLIDGVSNRVRIYRADTPETQNEQHCGGQEATEFAAWALSMNDTPGTVYLEKDATARDQYGRELAYVWFEVNGKPYMLNHILITNGWAEDVDYGDRKYDAKLQAAAFAQRHNFGVWELCGSFDVPLDSVQSPGPAQAPQPQMPAQEQPQPADSTVQQPDPVPSDPAPVPVDPAPLPVDPAPAAQEPSGCDPNYTGCVPNVSYDLDCGDIGFSVQVIGVDHHGFDREGDGIGCESYG
jgi:endonuclease YncB( thermonuclease family)